MALDKGREVGGGFVELVRNLTFTLGAVKPLHCHLLCIVTRCSFGCSFLIALSRVAWSLDPLTIAFSSPRQRNQVVVLPPLTLGSASVTLLPFQASSSKFQLTALSLSTGNSLSLSPHSVYSFNWGLQTTHLALLVLDCFSKDVSHFTSVALSQLCPGR